MMKKGTLLKTVGLSSSFSDDPLKSFIFIFGQEGSSTTSLALSIVDVIDEDKKVYILNTEPPHNETGIVLKHFKKEHDKGKFVLPTEKNTDVVIPITDKESFLNFKDKVLSSNDLGAFVIDAIDTLRVMLFMEYSKIYSFGMQAWAEADKAIINLFMDLLKLQIPVVVITKMKDKTIVEKSGNGIKVEKVTDEFGNNLEVPTLDNERIQRWASIRLKTLKIGKFIVDKTKGKIEKGETFEFKYSAKGRTGYWLPKLLHEMTSD